MFTGIITAIGTIRTRKQMDAKSDTQFVIGCDYDKADLAIGASIACDGICLTVTEAGEDKTGHWFAVETSAETLAVTAADAWQAGRQVNLEKSLRLGDELGGHIVNGHIDGLAEIINIEKESGSRRFTFAAPQRLMQYIAPKGAIALNGTSLTINEVTDGDSHNNGIATGRFGVNIIAHTLAVTNWGEAQIGTRVNLEIDMFARYVARYMEIMSPLTPQPQSKTDR